MIDTFRRPGTPIRYAIRRIVTMTTDATGWALAQLVTAARPVVVWALTVDLRRKP